MGETPKLSSYFSSKKQVPNVKPKPSDNKDQALSENVVFKFNFSLGDEKKSKENDVTESTVVQEENDTKSSKNNKKKKKSKKKKKKKDSASPKEGDIPVLNATEPSSLDTQKKEIPADKASDMSFLKLRKPTGSESEVMKMQMKYGKGKMNMAAITRRRQRLKEAEQKKKQDTTTEETASSTNNTFRFNFV